MSDAKTAEELTGITAETAARIMQVAKDGCLMHADHPELWPEACAIVWDSALEHELIDEHQHERGVLTASGEAPDVHINLGSRTE